MDTLPEQQLPRLVRARYWESQDGRLRYVGWSGKWHLQAGDEATDEDWEVLQRLCYIEHSFPTRSEGYRILASGYQHEHPPSSAMRFSGDYEVEGTPYGIYRKNGGWVVGAARAKCLTQSHVHAMWNVFGVPPRGFAFSTRQAALEALMDWHSAYIASTK